VVEVGAYRSKAPFIYLTATNTVAYIARTTMKKKIDNIETRNYAKTSA
jgi:hypothetical protein